MDSELDQFNQFETKCESVKKIQTYKILFLVYLSIESNKLGAQGKKNGDECASIERFSR